MVKLFLEPSDLVVCGPAFRSSPALVCVQFSLLVVHWGRLLVAEMQGAGEGGVQGEVKLAHVGGGGAGMQ